jgi:hypothetical protein
LCTLLMVYTLGFREAAQQIAGQPERLRDITFYIWDNYPSSKHGYLVFYSFDDFKKNIAYSNHSIAYLFYMYALYKIELLNPIFQMRIVSAVLNSLSLAGLVFYIISNITKKSIPPFKGLLVLLAVVFMVSMPGYWISLARFNVDNVYPLIFTLQTLIAFCLWKGKENGIKFYILTLLFAVFCPLQSIILGLALLLYAIRQNGFDTKLFKLAMRSGFVGVVFYLQAPLASKLLGFISSNSGWLFRSGLDGDLTYFSNAFLAVVSPYFPRPLHIIVGPLLLLLLQVIYFKTVTCMTASQGEVRCEVEETVNAGLFKYLIFSQYIFSWLLWPQAIAIHPYLYDFLFLAPVSILIILNFLRFPESTQPSQFWLLALLFLISFNFQQIAQAKCQGCHYPAWSVGSGKF